MQRLAGLSLILLCCLGLRASAQAQPVASQTAAVTLEDFRFPAWPVRWTTLEFSKYTPPQLHPAGKVKAPDGRPAGRVDLPAGGRIVLRTQVEAPEQWYGIRGKPPWPLPAGARKVSLAIRPEGKGAVRLKIHLHDPQKDGIALDAGTAQPGRWTTLTATLPGDRGPLRLHSLELTRAGQGQRPEPVWLAQLQAHLAQPSGTLHVAYGLQDHDRSLVVEDAAEIFLRLDWTGQNPRRVRIPYTITRRGASSPAARGEFNASLGAEPQSLLAEFRAEAPGVYDLAFDWPEHLDVQPVAATVRPRAHRNLHRKDITFTVYRSKPLAGDQLESERPNLQRVSAAAATGGFQAWRTNLSPALWLDVPDRRVQLFAGIGAQGLALPKYVAFAGPDGPVVASTDQPVDLSGMREPWLLLLAGDAAGWDRIGLRSMGQRVPAPMDLPWLLVLQKKPSVLRAAKTRLVVEFGAPAGRMALMPLYGVRTLDTKVTAGWARSLPDRVARHASSWSRRLQRQPVYVREDYRVDAQGDAVTIRQQFHYRPMNDAWGTRPLRSAPVPPMLTLARRYGMEIEFTDPDGRTVQPVDAHVAAASGPFEYIEGVEAYRYTIRGVLKYINEDRLPNPDARGPIARAMIDHMRNRPGHGEPGASASRWSPGITVREDYGIAMVGNSERQGLLGSTIPYCDDPAEALWRKRTLQVDAGYLTNPHCSFTQVDPRSGKLYNMEGFAWTRFGLDNWVDNNAYIAEVLRALDYYVKYTGDLEHVRRHWPRLRAAFAVVSDFKRHGEWELCCFDSGGGDTWDSTCNGTIAFARLADRLGDGDGYRAACYYHAKRAVTLAGQRQAWKFIDAMPYWASCQSVARITEDGKVAGYTIFGQKWVHPVATLRDLAFSDVWGQNMGLRPWNQTCWMRGSRAEFRMARQLTPSYASYWVDGRVRAFAPEWYQAVVVDKKLPPAGALDRRTGKPVEVYNGDYAGKITLAARAIVAGESAEELYKYWQHKPKLRVYGETAGRVPRLCGPAVILEDGMAQPWVRLYGKGASASSPGWQRGRDAVMDLGDENYMYGMRFSADAEGGPETNGVALQWLVFVGPGGKGPLHFGRFGPAEVGLRNGRTRHVTWNTTVYTAETGD